MQLTLSENIRMFRKQRKLTQEKLAEALGVTVGAVYKWESGLSVPELGMIVEIADFFEISVDALLGYKMQDHRMEALEKRLTEYCRTMDPAAVEEADKALAKYPYSFRIVYTAASIHLAYGAANHSKEELMRALDLLEQARVLLPQNDDPKISEATISGDMSLIWFQLNEYEKGLELLKKNNANGIFSGGIGACLAVYMGRPEEAPSYLSEAMLDALSNLFTTVLGYLFVYRSRNDWDQALSIISWSLDILNGIKTEGKIYFIDKTHAELLASLAYAQKKAGMKDASLASLKKAADIACAFDSRPDYSMGAIRFAEKMDQAVAFDILGATAEESTAYLISLFDDQELSEQWKELISHDRINESQR